MIIADPFLVPITLFIVGGAATVLTPIARAFARRMDREGARPAVPGEVSSRLERMEQAIEAIAVEVERISEGQRFTTKLLSERGSEPARELPTANEAER
jgi:hypothetical protein